jgi:hypothetical protein
MSDPFYHWISRMIKSPFQVGQPSSMKSIIFHFEKIEELHQPGSADTEVLLFTFPQYQLDDAYHSFHFASDLLFLRIARLCR